MNSGKGWPTARAQVGLESPSVPATATAALRGGHATHRRWPRGRGGGARPARRRRLPGFAARPSSDWLCRARPSYEGVHGSDTVAYLVPFRQTARPSGRCEARLGGMARAREIERLANALGEGSGREGLLQERGARAEYAMADDRVVGVARHVQHAEVGPEGTQPLGKLAATHPRHDHVGEQEIERALMPLADQ